MAIRSLQYLRYTVPLALLLAFPCAVQMAGAAQKTAGVKQNSADRVATKRDERSYRRAMTRLADARTLYFKVHDALRHQDKEYWFRKPNSYKVVRSDGDTVYSDGRSRTHITPDGKTIKDKAPRRYPEEVRVMDFDSFFDSTPKTHELMGLNASEFGGASHRAFWAKTTESGITYGQAFFDPSTMLPIGHHTSERDEITVDQLFTNVKIDPSLPVGFFRPAPRR